jgi:hypothetical protein
MVGIPSSSIAAVSFQKIVEDCIAGTLLKERALKLLESKYKSSVIDIKEALGEDFQSFCCYVPCDFDEYIKICDGAERNKPKSERLVNDKIIQKVIEKVTAAYKKNDLESGKVVIEVYQEVHQIQNWCRENRELAKWYEKCKADIDALPDILSQKVNVAKNNIDMAIDLLIDYSYIKKIEKRKIKDKIIPEEYWIITSVKDVMGFLEEKKRADKIHIGDIKTFMKTKLKGKKGGSIANSFKTEKSKARKKS